ncbi:MAG: hypothetical protein JSU77_12755 [Fidelibacterota bacterium]|nr:MAG: hypothetical protein JSU77_12755 [Candidatus Neomarinimicrobiota bacterium]
MGKVLIIEKDIRTIEVLEMLLQALRQPYNVVNTHANVMRIYKNEQVDVIFMNPEIPLVDPKALIDEMDGATARLKRSRPPIVFLYTDDGLVRRFNLNIQPGCQIVRKPVTMEQIYELLDGMGLTKLKITAGNQQVKDKITRFEDFIEQSEDWMEKLKGYLLKS